MNNIQNPYNQQPPQMGQPMMPPPMPRARVRTTWWQRLLGGANMRPLTLWQERTIPNRIVGSSIAVFFVAMVSCWMAFGHVPAFDLWLAAAISVVLFFYGCDTMAKNWAMSNEKTFLKNVFIAGFIIRLLWVLYCYFFFNPEYYDTTFGSRADVEWYMPFGEAIAEWIRGNSRMTFIHLIDAWYSAIDDVGYPLWLAIIYLLTGSISDVFIPFMVKSIAGAYCAICIYHVAKRHFGEGAARMAALFICLNPNMIYWCASMMKETEMVFLCCLSMDLVDKTFTSGKQLTLKGLLPGILSGLALFFFRAALGMVIFLAMFAHIVMASGRVMSIGKKIIAGVLVGATLLVGMGDRMLSQTERIVEMAQSDSQQKNMEWRSERKGGNSFAKYASSAVFAPLIFTIPFPTFNTANDEQLVQVQLAGGSYIKNVLSFFVLLIMFLFLITGEWRKHVFIIAYTLGYLMALVLSGYAQSGRFHMPIWPMLMLFAAYGIQLAKTNTKIRKWWPMVLVAEVVVCLAWNWFKLKGRGMI